MLGEVQGGWPRQGQHLHMPNLPQGCPREGTFLPCLSRGKNRVCLACGGSGSGPPSPRGHGGWQHPHLVPGVVVVLQRDAIGLDLEEHKAVTHGACQPRCPRAAARLCPLTWKGPCSFRNPSMELQPGPPFSHSTKGLLWGLLWASTNLRTSSVSTQCPARPPPGAQGAA